MTRRHLLVLAATTGLLCTVLAPTALAADTAGPDLKTAKNATFVVGSQIGPMALDEEGDPVQTDGILMTTTWSATDPSGVCGYRTRDTYAGFAPDPWTPWSSTHQATRTTTDYDDQQGGGSFKFEGIDIQARDCAGNISSTAFVSFFPMVWQDSGESFGYGTLDVTYRGSWAVSHCACWSGGTTHKTSAKNARVDFVLHEPGSTYSRAGLVAVVMETASNRGRVQILIDGKVKGTVDTYSPTTKHRTVIWAGYFPRSAKTLSVVDLATSARPRIDVDAILTTIL